MKESKIIVGEENHIPLIPKNHQLTQKIHSELEGNTSPIIDSPRKPLTPVQKKQLVKSIGSNSTIESKAKINTSSKIDSPRKKAGLVPTKQTKKNETEETIDPIDIITGEKEPLAYWKELAEERRKALEIALAENEKLHERILILEQENKELEDLVNEASELAEMVNNLPEDPDESGIVKDGPNTAEDDGSSTDEQEENPQEHEKSTDDSFSTPIA